MPKITVLTTSYEPRYPMEQLESLVAQTFEDFEWIVVDDCYDKNLNIFPKMGFPIIHIPPQNLVPYFAKASALNDGLVYATGEIVYFMNDYVLPEKKCLERHYEVQKRLGGVMLAGRALKVDMSPQELNKLKKIKSHDYRMSLFDQGYYKCVELGDGLFEVPRAGIQNWMNGRNDSCPLEPLLECNGFDEAFDGRWGGEDADMANRLMTYGLKYIMDRNSMAFEFPHISGAKKSVRSEKMQQSFQERIINEKVKNKVYTANTDWFVMLPRDLKDERNRIPQNINISIT